MTVATVIEACEQSSFIPEINILSLFEDDVSNPNNYSENC